MVVSSWAWMNKMENLCFIEIWGGFFPPEPGSRPLPVPGRGAQMVPPDPLFITPQRLAGRDSFKEPVCFC